MTRISPDFFVSVKIEFALISCALLISLILLVDFIEISGNKICVIRGY